MRGVFVRNVGVGILALALTVLASCNSDPLSFDVKDTAGIVVTPTYMVLTAGKTAQIFSRTVNAGQEPTYEVITAALDATCGIATLVIVPDNDVVPAEPPGRFDVTAGVVLGTTCITLTGGGATATVEVVVVAADIEITNNPGTVRAGDTGILEARLVDFDGNTAGPYDVLATTWASDNTAAVNVATDGAYVASEAGTAVVTVTWLGQEANGTAGLGVDITDDAAIEVTATVPANAYYAVTGDSTTSLGTSAQGQVVDFVVSVEDAFGNLNTFPDEIVGVTVTSSNLAAATATAAIVTDDPDLGAGDVPVVTVTTLGPGVTSLDGFVTVSTGTDLSFTGVLTVLAPSVTALTNASGSFAEFATISGSGFVAAGFATAVRVDGQLLGNFTVVSDTEITAQMPTYADPGIHNLVVEVGGVPSTEAVTWEQTNSCYANDFPPEPGFDGPFVDVSYPLECDGTASDLSVADTWFFADVSADAILASGGGNYSVTLAPTWGPPLKDIDWYWDDCTFTVFEFAVDQPPGTFSTDLDAGCSLFIMDDFAAFQNGDFTVQDYTIIVTVDE